MIKVIEKKLALGETLTPSFPARFDENRFNLKWSNAKDKHQIFTLDVFFVRI